MLWGAEGGEREREREKGSQFNALVGAERCEQTSTPETGVGVRDGVNGGVGKIP